MKLSLCITNYNRTELLWQSFEKVLHDPRITEIIIVDDCSSVETVDFLAKMSDQHDKIDVYTNSANLGMQRNKARAIEKAKNEWCILLDSDNEIDPSYIDALKEWPLQPEVIYCPSFAKPDFNYEIYERRLFSAKHAATQIKQDSFNMMMNTCNYVVNRQRYLSVFKYNPAHISSDTIWFNYNWLLSGGKFFVVPDMHYFHRVHAGSGFLQNADYNMNMAEKVRKMITKL